MGELTSREAGIVYHVYTGCTLEAIAERYGISPNTLRNHLTSIYSKTGARNRTQLAVMAWEAMG